MREDRPWGYYQILSESHNYKTKLIYIKENSKLSYQKHKFRNEHWFIVSGTASVIKNGDGITLYPGDSIDFLAGDLHRIGATDTPVTFIEVQTGIYFGEDDIERIEDDYGR